VCHSPSVRYFKPAGVPTSALEEIVLQADELEAMRLVDLDGLYHDPAAEQMGVSRRTFGRIIESARKKVTEALVQGLALRIEGGVVQIAGVRTFRCGSCRERWELPAGEELPDCCPHCRDTDIERAAVISPAGPPREADVDIAGKASDGVA
jgi:predicted DNA-binding protein (UPF0251 family)